MTLLLMIPSHWNVGKVQLSNLIDITIWAPFRTCHPSDIGCKVLISLQRSLKPVLLGSHILCFWFGSLCQPTCQVEHLAFKERQMQSSNLINLALFLWFSGHPIKVKLPALDSMCHLTTWQKKPSRFVVARQN